MSFVKRRGLFIIAHDGKHPAKKQLVVCRGFSMVLMLCTKFFVVGILSQRHRKMDFLATVVKSDHLLRYIVVYIFCNFLQKAVAEVYVIVIYVAPFIEMKDTSFQRTASNLLQFSSTLASLSSCCKKKTLINWD